MYVAEILRELSGDTTVDQPEPPVSKPTTTEPKSQPTKPSETAAKPAPTVLTLLFIVTR